MGARPVAAFLSLGVPRELTMARRGRAWNGKSWVDLFLKGLLALAAEYKVPLAGGDLAESSLAVADIVLVGAVERGKALLRSGAKPGDRLFVTGALGGAALGLERLEKLSGAWKREVKETAPSLAPSRIPKRLEEVLGLRFHLHPQPRIAQGLLLRQRELSDAALDISDGLSTDLRHLCEESGVAAEVDADALPLAPGATLEQALHGGEDYELLFTAAATARVPRSIQGVAITPIGRLVKAVKGQPTITLIQEDNREPLSGSGWEHFS
jgi:thiamine-monophosphate kinase